MMLNANNEKMSINVLTTSKRANIFFKKSVHNNLKLIVKAI